MHITRRRAVRTMGSDFSNFSHHSKRACMPREPFGRRRSASCQWSCASVPGCGTRLSDSLGGKPCNLPPGTNSRCEVSFETRRNAESKTSIFSKLNVELTALPLASSMKTIPAFLPISQSLSFLSSPGQHFFSDLSKLEFQA